MAQIRDWKLEETNLGRARQIPYEVAVLPIGATEAHNLHLPYSTDSLQVQAIAERACERAWGQGAEVLLLPTVSVGVNENCLGFLWTLSLKPTTILAILRDIVSSLEHHHLLKLVVLNGHGGNELKPFLRELHRETKVRIVLVNWWEVDPEGHSAIFEQPGEHGDEMETSLMMHLHPELVELERADEGRTREPHFTGMKQGWAWISRPWDLLTTNSGVGDPAKATAQKGEQYMERVVTRIAGLLVEMANEPIDDWYPYESD
ncbi:MAG: creatininase family protein [Armatimonadota bacterium]